MARNYKSIVIFLIIAANFCCSRPDLPLSESVWYFYNQERFAYEEIYLLKSDSKGWFLKPLTFLETMPYVPISKMDGNIYQLQNQRGNTIEFISNKAILRREQETKTFILHHRIKNVKDYDFSRDSFYGRYLLISQDTCSFQITTQKISEF